MKALNALKYIFAGVGAALLVGAAIAYQSTSRFLQSAATTQGTVIRLEPSRSGNSATYSPVVQFDGPDGRSIEFTSSVSSNPPAHSVGERVSVHYEPARPERARLSGFFDLWFGAVIAGGLGTLFLAIGGGWLLADRARGRRAEELSRSGQPIATRLQSITRDENLKVMGRHPFRIYTQWQDPSSSEVRTFKSDAIWFDPTPHVTNETITVLIEPGNPRRYHMDLSFLPKAAD